MYLFCRCFYWALSITIQSLPLGGEGVRRGAILAQCVGDNSRLTDEVESWYTLKQLLQRLTVTPYPSRAN